MKPNFYLFILVICLGNAIANAQTMLTSDLNNPRIGDKLVRQHMGFYNCEQTGKGNIWNLADVELLDDYSNSIYQNGHNRGFDILDTEGRTNYFLDVKGDSLSILGFENNTVNVSYSSPIVLLRYPMAFGDSISSHFSGKGTYCEEYDIDVDGFFTSKVDASGIIVTPTNDTINDVLRLKSDIVFTCNVVNDSTLFHSRDNNTVKETLIRWYARGERYPIIESIIYEYGDIELLSSYYCPPHAQRLLDNDDNNEKERTRGRNVLASGSSKCGITTSGDFSYVIYTTKGSDAIRIEYSTGTECPFACFLYDYSGALVWTSPSNKVGKGAHYIEIDNVKKKNGVYIIVFAVGENRYTEKLVING